MAVFYAGTSSATIATNNTIWYSWCDGTSADTVSDYWITWTANSAATVITVGVDVGHTTPEMAAERAAYQRRLDESVEQRRKAIACARALLLAMLTHQQRESLQRDRFFEVIAKHSKRRYRIRQGTHGNVKLLDDSGREVMSYCGQPNGVPEDDAMLAQKLQIEHDEDEYLKRANATRVA